MAGNSVPAFFGAKARSFKPPGVDVTFLTDISGSMTAYLSFFLSTSTITALELALRAEGIGITSSNRYSFTVAGPGFAGVPAITAVERPVLVNGISTRWATGSQLLDGSALPPTEVARFDNEDVGFTSNYVTETDREYAAENAQIILAGSDEQSYETAFVLSPTYPHRYVGIHNVFFTVAEPAGPNPVPAGVLFGFVYTTETTGVAVYTNGGSINYRFDVPAANVTATAVRGTLQSNIDRAADTNGAIYDIRTNFNTIATSLGTVLGGLLYASA